MNTYLDNAATTKPAPEVVDAMKPYLTTEYGNASSLHSLGRTAREAVEKSREAIAKQINASPEEIIFTSGGSESDNTALFGMVSKEKNHVITSRIEHPAVYNTCKYLEKQGYVVTFLDVDEYGLVDSSQLADSITDETAVVSVMHANNEIGTVQPVESIGKICSEHDVPFHTDAVQSFTKEPIDVKNQDISLASFSAHKIHGPKGVGALYIRKGTKLNKLVHGGSHEHNLRAGTENVPGIVGFAKAVELAKPEHNNQMKKLRDQLIKGVMRIEDTLLNGHPIQRLCNNTHFCFKFIEGEALVYYLDNLGVSASTGSACSSHSLEPSHILTAIGRDAVTSHGSLRLSLSRYTTKEEVDYAIEKVDETIKKLRAMSPFKKKSR